MKDNFMKLFYYVIENLFYNGRLSVDNGFRGMILELNRYPPFIKFYDIENVWIYEDEFVVDFNAIDMYKTKDENYDSYVRFHLKLLNGEYYFSGKVGGQKL